MKMLGFKFQPNRTLNEEFDHWGFKGPRGPQHTPKVSGVKVSGVNAIIKI